MEITNKYNYPEALVLAAKNDPYTFEGDISTTGLISPPQLFQLRKRHGHMLTEDVSDRIWSLLGQGLHAVLERAKSPTSLVEERFYAEMDGWVLGGQIDVYDKDTKTLWDYKLTKVWSIISGPKFEWTAQANINRWLMSKQKNPLAVFRSVNVAFLKDWDEHRATGKPQKNGKMYPDKDVQQIPLPLWELGDTEAYIRGRVNLHKEASLLPDDQLPACTEEDTWGGKRCKRWCPVSSICPQYAKEKA